MENKNIIERELKPANGIAVLILLILALIASAVLFIVGIATESGAIILATSILFIVLPALLPGLKMVRPNEARVLLIFGKYYGTIKTSGYFFVNPFSTTFSPNKDSIGDRINRAISDKSSDGISLSSQNSVNSNISLKRQTMENQRQKVNDVLGNPIIIGAVVIWRVENPTKAVFAVENYQEFLSIQTDSTIRNITRQYPYDIFEDENDDGYKEKSLRASSLEIAQSMRDELQTKVADAGLLIEEVRITHLAYAEEIAAAMLQRQQAAAIIAARQKIVDGAVGMVKMAIDKLGEDEVVVLDEERKASMVSNLLVVLCGNKDAQPIVNGANIY